MSREEMLIATMRQETKCRGCNKKKEKGLIVCWDCFKHRKDVMPYKYHEGTTEEWLKQTRN